MSKVIEFPSKTITPDALLDMCKAVDLREAMIVGLTADGNVFFTSTIKNTCENIGLLEVAKFEIMDLPAEE